MAGHRNGELEGVTAQACLLRLETSCISNNRGLPNKVFFMKYHVALKKGDVCREG